MLVSLNIVLIGSMGFFGEGGICSRESNACHYSSFILFRMICVRYLMEILEKVSIKFCSLLVGLLSSVSFFVVVMWMEP